jgi:ATP-binding cassette subfamily B (MDR/TAP) protein 1
MSAADLLRFFLQKPFPSETENDKSDTSQWDSSLGDPSLSSLRIVSLLPAATDICVCLHLEDYLVGITHECDSVSTTSTTTNTATTSSIRVITKTAFDANHLSQSQIHETVQLQQQQQQDPLSCSRSINHPLDLETLLELQPTVVLTQDLCSVCGPSLGSVQRALIESKSSTHGTNFPNPTIVTLSPTSLEDIWRDIGTVARVCGVPERGHRVVSQIQTFIATLRTFPHIHNEERRKPGALFFEWLDPPFDAGHWIPEMIDIAGLEYLPLNGSDLPNSTTTNSNTQPNKSMYVPWEVVGSRQCNNNNDNAVDMILVACCGFDVERNVRDIQSCEVLQTSLIQPALQRTDSNHKQPPTVFALDGNLFFNRPGPLLAFGCVILAMACLEVQSNADEMDIKEMKRRLWQALDLDEKLQHKLSKACQAVDVTTSKETLEIKKRLSTPDVEECHDSWDKIHEHACNLGQDSYCDPTTGYHVFTERAHLRRGFCCGSGCRHCPYAHANVKDKVSKIQQPAFVHEGQSPFHLSDCRNNIKILFFSGGKDSFLALRALIRETCQAQQIHPLFSIILLTTFDAPSRIVAHQDIPIANIVRQAEHLGLPLLGVPLHRQSSVSYKDRISQALKVVEKKTTGKISALVFGDLHLQDIRKWREDQLACLGVPTEYPLWKMDYTELMDDLEASGISCVLSAVTNPDAGKVGDVFDRTMMKRVMIASIDGFGENGEFHTQAEVWSTSRMKATGMPW